MALLAAAQAAQKSKAPPAPNKPASSAAAGRSEALRLNNLGAAYMGQQRFADAERMFFSALQREPKLTVAQLNRGIALLYLQRFDAARAALDVYSRQHPSDARGWYNLGLLEKAQGHAQPALRDFQHAAQLAPADPDVHYYVGATTAQLGQGQAAIAAFQRALQLNPYHASAEFGLARAYQHLGDAKQAQAHLARFQQLTQSKLGTPMSLAYGDQGALSLAVTAAGEQQQVPPPIQVKFESVGQQSGITSVRYEGPAPPPQLLIGAAACALDYDNDGLPDIYTGSSLYRNAGGGKFEDVSAKAGLGKIVASACAAADFDNDGHTDLAIAIGGEVLLYRNRGDGTFEDVTQRAGISTKGAMAGLTWFDFDHDGDADLYVSFGAGGATSPTANEEQPGHNELWRNNGNGAFTLWSTETALQGTGDSVQALPTDFNNDRAVDLLVTAATTRLYLNPREGKWGVGQTLSGNSIAAAGLDFDHDGWMDLAVTSASAPGLRLYRNVAGKSLSPVNLPDLHWVRAWGVAAFDFDNDGWTDLIAIGETADGRSELRLLRNQGDKGFRDVTSETGLDRLQLKNSRQVVPLDYDGDGDLDLVVTQLAAPTLLLRNDGGNANHAIRLALKGTNDNKSAIGTKVEVFAGGLYQKLEVSGAGYFSQSATDVLVGLGQRTEADVVRLLWPTGVVQDEVEIAAGKTKEIDELDRRASSCPILFAWDGHRYRFVSDMLGAGVVGHWIAPHTRNISDPTEYLKIEPFSAQPRNGKLSFRFMEPMEEVVYLDQVRLLAVDHPRDLTVFPNERFLSNPPYPDFKVVASRGARPVRAWEDRGHDVSSELSRRDHRYVGDFRLLPFKGFTEPHTLTLDLNEAYRGGPLRLLMSGYIEYFTATSMYAASQAGLAPVAPYVEAEDAPGHWTRVVDDMGFPAGLPRTITVDLSGKVPAGARRIRITTNLQIYWDQVLVDRTPVEQPVHVSQVPLASAALRFHGYPRALEGSSPGDLRYIYEQSSPRGPYAREVGAYTREGDVLPLLQSGDDRFAVFGSGEEVAVDFDASSLPPLPPGWTRDYFFFADGYEKDMDFYAADPLTVEPLPFRGMGEYPPAQAYPADAAHTRYRLQYNTRFITRPGPQMPQSAAQQMPRK